MLRFATLLLAGMLASAGFQAQTSMFQPSKAPVRLATSHPEDTHGLTLNQEGFQHVRNTRPGTLEVELDLPGLGWVSIEMQAFCNLSDEFVIARTTNEGTREEHYMPESDYVRIDGRSNGIR